MPELSRRRKKRTAPKPAANPEAGAVQEKILSFARERFLSEGFSKFSVDEISSELGISKKTFYKFFKSKEDLLNRMMEAIMADVDGNFARVLGSKRTFVEKLNEITAFLGLRLSTFSRPFQRDVQRHAPGIWKRMQDFRRHRIMTHFGQLLKQGVREGFVRRDVDERLFLLTYLGAIESLVNPSVLANESFSAQEALHTIVEICFRGILTENAARQDVCSRTNQHSQLL